MLKLLKISMNVNTIKICVSINVLIPTDLINVNAKTVIYSTSIYEVASVSSCK